MLNDSFISDCNIKADNIKLFEAFPGNFMLLEANPPIYSILAVTPKRLLDIGIKKEAVIGKPLFEAHPGNPTDRTDNGVSNLRSSLEQVMLYKESHVLPIQRYDLQNKDGTFSEKYWRAGNSPVLDDEGQVAYIIHSAEDITQEVKSGELLEKMKGMEQANNLLLQIPLPVCILTGPSLIIKMANEQTIELWGKTADVIGLPLEQAVPEVKGQGFAELLNEVRESGVAQQVYERPVSLIRNGKEEVVYINYSYQPYYKENSVKPDGVLAIGNDVTEQVQLRIRANENEERFRTLADQAPMMVFLADIEAEVTYWNRYCLEYTGQSFEEAVGRSWETFVHPEDYENLIHGYVTAAKAKEGYSIEARIRHRDGQYNYFLLTGGPRYSFNGTFKGNFGTGINIHDRKLAENAIKESEINLRNSILQSPVATCILLGPSFVLDIANARMYELWGRGAEELLHKPIFEGLPEARNQGLEELLTNVYTTGESFAANERPAQFPGDGKVRQVYVNFNYQPYYDANGSITGVLAVAIEVTEQVKARQEIEQIVTLRTNELAATNEALIESNRDLGRSNINLAEFAYAASHDLKEPIRKIRVFADRIKGTLSERMLPGEKYYFDRMEAAASRMASLIETLLSYSVVSMQKERDEDINLNDLLAVVLDDLELEIEEKKAIIKVENLFTIKGHLRQLQQAFQNLVANALKYSRAEVVPEVTISCDKLLGKETSLDLSEKDQEKNFYCLTIRDNGIGFKQEYAERIFNVFTRLHGMTEYQGTGIGLSIVRKVIENHNGHIWAESQPGEGSAFRVLLPVD
jgi:PAS domain S-box-containing protein